MRSDLVINQQLSGPSLVKRVYIVERAFDEESQTWYGVAEVRRTSKGG